MQWRNTTQQWGSVAKLLHWSIALGVLVMIGLGWWAGRLPYGPLKVDVFWVHKSLGMLILAAMVLRLIWRLFNPAPPGALGRALDPLGPLWPADRHAAQWLGDQLGGQLPAQRVRLVHGAAHRGAG